MESARDMAVQETAKGLSSASLAAAPVANETLLDSAPLVLEGAQTSAGILANIGPWQWFLIGAWFAILITGRYPRGLFDYVVGVGRWALRVTAYATLLVTDRYPPFRLD